MEYGIKVLGIGALILAIAFILPIILRGRRGPKNPEDSNKK